MKRKTKLINTFTFIISFAFFIIYILIYNEIDNIGNLSNYKYLLCTLGWVIYIYIVYSWYCNTKKIIDLYVIFMTMFFLFNYGQCLLWTFNIHKANDLNSILLYGKISLTDSTIVKAQIFTLMCILFYHLGATLYITNSRKKIKKKHLNIEEQAIKKYVLNLTKIMLILIVPLTYYYLIKKIIYTSSNSYMELFYGNSSFGILTFIQRLFFPSIFALMISSNFKKKIVKVSYILIAIYFMLSIFIGNRGELVYELLIILYIQHRYINKIKTKNIFLYIIGFISLMFIMTAMKELRNSGITIQNIIQIINIDNNPIIDAFFEMGSSLGIQATLIQNGYNIYPFGNTYVLSILGIVSDKFINFLGIEYIDLSTWFSQIYLGLVDWGAGFSMVGESLINYGPYYGIFFMIILGYIITFFINISDNDTCLKKIFSLISFISFIQIIRGAISYYLKVWFFTLFVFYTLLYLYICLEKHKNK